MSHETHCNQGEYEGSCKYGEASTCPMLKEPTPQEPAGSVPGGTATPAGCGPLEPVGHNGARTASAQDQAIYKSIADNYNKVSGFEPVATLCYSSCCRGFKIENHAPDILQVGDKLYSADTIAALQAEISMLRTGDTCARQCEGTAYRIEARRLQIANEKLQAELAEAKAYNAGRTDELIAATRQNNQLQAENAELRRIADSDDGAGGDGMRLVLENSALKRREAWLARLFERKWNGVVGDGSKYTYHLRGYWRHLVGELSGLTFSDAIDAELKEGK